MVLQFAPLSVEDDHIQVRWTIQTASHQTTVAHAPLADHQASIIQYL